MTDINNANEELIETPLAENAPAAESIHENAAPSEKSESVDDAPAATEEPAEAVADADTSDAAPTDDSETETVAYESTTQVIDALKQILANEDLAPRSEIEAIKSQFYRLVRQAAEAAHHDYIAQGGDAATYVPMPNPDEAAFKELMSSIKEKRAVQMEHEKQELEDNYQKKLAIIEQIKTILSNPDEVNKSYNDFKELQKQWNDIKSVPAESATELWKNYQYHVELFYDTLKLNNELRSYDFKKNLELKTELCERAEKLAEAEDVISAFAQLQQLHQEFREIGPVERELRESIWTRFKTASTTINKRHQAFFEERKAQEQENLVKKTALCEQVEAVDINSLKTFSDWNTQSEKIVALQNEWKTIGYAPKSSNVKIFERFRLACDNFFKQKAEYFKTVRDSLQSNLQAKQALVEKAEALKDSTAWRETTQAIVDLQKQWKEIGTVPKKYSEDIWKRFNDACDAFFEAKKNATGSQNAEQRENLQKKKDIINRLAALAEEGTDNLRDLLRKAQEEWNEIGHVPFREKETIYQAFRAQMDRLYGALHETTTKRRVSQFRQEVKDTDGKVRERLLRQYDILKNEIKTYENNLGFLTLSSKSKSGNQLVNELNRKVEKLRSDLQEIKMKIDALKKPKAADKDKEASDSESAESAE